MSLGFVSAEIGSKQSFGISDSLMYGSVCVTRKRDFFIGDRAQLKMHW